MTYREDVFNKLKEILIENNIIFSKEANEELTIQHSFFDILVDDLDIIEITMEIENHYHIRIPDERLRLDMTMLEYIELINEMRQVKDENDSSDNVVL